MNHGCPVNFSILTNLRYLQPSPCVSSSEYLHFACCLLPSIFFAVYYLRLKPRLDGDGALKAHRKHGCRGDKLWNNRCMCWSVPQQLLPMNIEATDAVASHTSVSDHWFKLVKLSIPQVTMTQTGEPDQIPVPNSQCGTIGVTAHNWLVLFSHLWCVYP